MEQLKKTNPVEDRCPVSIAALVSHWVPPEIEISIASGTPNMNTNATERDKRSSIVGTQSWSPCNVRLRMKHSSCSMSDCQGAQSRAAGQSLLAAAVASSHCGYSDTRPLFLQRKRRVSDVHSHTRSCCVAFFVMLILIHGAFRFGGASSSRSTITMFPQQMLRDLEL